MKYVYVLVRECGDKFQATIAGLQEEHGPVRIHGHVDTKLALCLSDKMIPKRQREKFGLQLHKEGVL